MPEQTNVTLHAAGTADFGTITLAESMVGNTYTYSISETTNDKFGTGWTKGSPVTATLVVTDDGKGNLVGTVTYAPTNKTSSAAV